MPSSLVLRLSLALVLLIVGSFGSVGCASNEGGPARPDAGRGDGSSADGGGACRTEADCADDGIFCNGGVLCREGACTTTPAPTCSDSVACTRDECLAATDVCQNIPDNTLCPSSTVCETGSGCVTPAACEFDTDCGGDGVVFIDGKSTPNTVSNANTDADCTVAITLENLAALMTGELEPTTGFMMGKFKVSGDMSVAMKLQRVV